MNSEIAKVFCPFCGDKNPVTNKLCSGCGKEIPYESAAPVVPLDPINDVVLKKKW